MGRNYTEFEMQDWAFEAHLDDAFGEVEICGIVYGQGQALRAVDPVAFRCAKADYQHWECEHCGCLHTVEDEAALCCEEEDQDDE